MSRRPLKKKKSKGDSMFNKFPKAPDKVVGGYTSIIVKPPLSTAIETTPEPPKEDLGEDFSAGIKIEAPLGFSIDVDLVSLSNRHKESAKKRLLEIKQRMDTCPSCKKRGDILIIEAAEKIVEQAYSIFEGKNIVALVNHHHSGDIDIQFCNNACSIKVFIEKYKVNLECIGLNGFFNTKQVPFSTLAGFSENCIWLAGQ